MSCKGSSETPLHFISRYKGLSVGRYRRYRLHWLEVPSFVDWELNNSVPINPLLVLLHAGFERLTFEVLC